MQKALLVIGVLVVILLVAVVGLVLKGGLPGAGAPVAGEAEGAAEPNIPAMYYDLGEDLVVNFVDGRGLRFLQIHLQVLIRNESVIEALQAHDPKIRHHLLMLLSGLDQESLVSEEGRKVLRKRAEEEINRVLSEEGSKGEVKAVYFTKFVMQ